MMYEQLLARISDADLRAAAAKTFEIAESFIARRATIDKDARFSESGRLEALTADLEKEFLPALRSSRQPLRAARDAIANRKAKITLPPVDRSDAVAAIERAERRSFLAKLESSARMRLLLDDRTDLKIIDAALEAPELAGLERGKLYDELLGKRLRGTHGAEMASVERAEEAVSAAEAAVTIALNRMRAAFDPRNGERFNTIVAKAA